MIKNYKQEYMLIDYTGINELQKLICDTYGFKEFIIACEEEKSNDSYMVVEVDGDIDEWDQEEIDKRETTFLTRAYMNDLGNKGLLDKGKYLLDISW